MNDRIQAAEADLDVAFHSFNKAQALLEEVGRDNELAFNDYLRAHGELNRLRAKVDTLRELQRAQGMAPTPAHEAGNPVRPLTREGALELARTYITRDRNADYGEPEDNFAHIAAYWSNYFGQEFTPVDVAAMFALMKIARLRTSEAKADNWVDAIGYLACGAECARAA